ncbi:MAG: hypothetical protein JXQ66_01170 [Campylobacterales bacterium]|nr:hypothetical protein [Campylobacterales bacterium]
MRKGFGLWQAMMMILLVSGMLIVVLKYASISAKHVGDSYIREQAELYLNSVIEKTLLKISIRDRNESGCLSDFNDTKSNSKGSVTYNANVEVKKYYLLDGSDDATYCASLTELIQTEESHGYVLMDVEVNATVDGKLKTRIVRRTLQRP